MVIQPMIRRVSFRSVTTCNSIIKRAIEITITILFFPVVLWQNGSTGIPKKMIQEVTEEEALRETAAGSGKMFIKNAWGGYGVVGANVAAFKNIVKHRYVCS